MGQGKDDDEISVSQLVNNETGELMPAEMAQMLRSRLISGEMRFELSDEVAAELADMGLTADDIKDLLLLATAKAMS